MSITIHHGSNGSYKSASATWDYIIPALREGRPVVTNLRGMSIERCREHLPDIHPDAVLIHVDTGTTAGLKRARTWWHWCPIGALLVFDEAAIVFPSTLKPADIADLRFGATLEDATAAGRPHNWDDAWQMQRHYNFDVILTLPDISLLRSDIRATAEGAYRHVNLGIVGIKGRYKEGYHRGSETGTLSQLQGQKIRKIPKMAFKFYDSTATGKHRDTLNSAPLWKNGSVMGGLVLVVAAAGYALSHPPTVIAGGVTAALDSRQALPPGGAGSGGLGGVGLDRVDVRPPGRPDPVDHPYAGYRQAGVSGSARFGAQRRYSAWLQYDDGQLVRVTGDHLKSAGYTVTETGDCGLFIVWQSFSEHWPCRPPPPGSGVPGAGGGVAGIWPSI